MPAVLTEPVTTVLRFEGGLAGFPHVEHFTLSEVPDAAPLHLLTSVDASGPEFVVVPPNVFFPDYAPDIDDESAQRLGLTDPADAIVLLVITLGAQVESSTANLLAPVVVNTRSLRAAQVILTGDWPLRAPLLRT